ncbi:hypothetical protein E1193_04025 [Micromonospora sp. KC606]|uniref:hypothetical protein n=1 Tax=Micromonospora sp. KC606 TaxID=2530379 RepID=UPI00104FEAD7|nr:hypothetical protein [Micromonospora sp. KC606]TDC85080.1 hypothetical protein E1193_04025 [Micromonospora sp. KC606]
MERIEFRTVAQEFGDGGVFPALVPHLSGVPLPDLVREAELPFARREGKPDLAGSYAGLLGDEVGWPSRHYLGDPVLSWFDDGDTVLLGCGCGEWGCWPFTAIVTVAEDTVTWSGFRNGHREWDYRELRSFTFDRIQYEEAVRSTGR